MAGRGRGAPVACGSVGRARARVIGPARARWCSTWCSGPVTPTTWCSRSQTSRPLADAPSADKCWAETETHWRRAVPVIDEPALAPRDAEQAMAVLVGLTSTSGGMAAAATTSLPERARQGRNYDYRYAWIRDQTFAGLAAAAHHHDGLLDSAVGFVADRLLADGPQLKPAYTVDGRPVPDQRPIPGLSGYPGAGDRVGNWVNQQFQLDTFGEALELLAAASRAGRLDRDHWRAAQVAADAIEQRGHEPDAGVWEIEPRRWAHSRLTCVSGLRAIAAEAPGAESGRWSALADAMLAEVSADCLHPDGRWQRAPDDPRVDAALLLPIVRGGLAPSDPRSAATVDAVAAELMRQDYVYRFRHDDRPLDAGRGRLRVVRVPAGTGPGRPGSNAWRPGFCSSAIAAPAAARACWPRSSMWWSANCAATCPRPSCTPCSSSAAPRWRRPAGA